MQVLPKNFAMLFRTAFLLNTVRQLFLERHWIDETEVFLQFFGLGFHGFRDICTSLWCAEAHLGDFRTSMVERLAKKIKDF